MSLQEDVAGQLAPWRGKLAAAVRASPSSDIYDVVARPDVSRLLESGLLAARELAEGALGEVWPEPDSSPYRASLFADIGRAYATAAAVLREAAIDGYRQSPEAMSRKVAAAIWSLAFRNEMTISVAETRQQGEKALNDAKGTGQSWEKKWVCRKGPNGLPDSRVCAWCRRLDAMPPIPVGVEFPPLEPIGKRRPPRVYHDLQCPPAHPRCLPGDSLVSAESVTGASARVYHGEMVSIRTLSGKLLRATPNHPVLTDHGWVSAGLLGEGDYVVSTCGEQRILGSHQDDESMPATIQQVAEAFLCSRGVSSAEVPLSAEDFHGDGIGSEIGIVGSYRSLPAEGQVPFSEHVREHVFQRANVSLGFFHSLGDTAPLFPGLMGSSYSSVGGGSSGLTLLRRELGLVEVQLLALSPEPDASLAESVGHDVAASLARFRQRFDALAGKVALDEIIEIVKDDSFHGPVYNLETELGWYIGSGIVVHNCRCRLIVVTPGISDVAGVPLSPAEALPYVTAQSVRDMSAGRYKAQVDFHRAALHELGQVLRKRPGYVGRRP